MAFAVSHASGQPFLLDALTHSYASVKDPLAISFGADGSLFVARDNTGSGGGAGDAVKIHRIAPGGTAVSEYGNVAVSDPDTLLYDAMGTVSGVAGSVLVGGVHTGNTGKISRIAPDGAVTTLWGPSGELWNPTDMVFDAEGRLLISDVSAGRVSVSTGGTPTLLFTLANAHQIAVDSLGRILVSTSTGNDLRLYSSSGTLLNATFARVRAASPLVLGPGGSWGTDLYAVAPGGDLIRITTDGTTNRLGGGFDKINSITFGPDGALYASDFDKDTIWRLGVPAIPGAKAAVYARVTDPVRLAFAPDGTLYTGRDNSGSGGGFADPVKIHRIAPGGGTVTEYGAAAIPDADGVAYDASGTASGIPGATLVGGHLFNSPWGQISAIRPDQGVVTIYGPTAFTFNPNVFTWDVTGRLLFSDDEGGKVWVMTNGVVSQLFSLSGALFLSVDSLNRIVVGVATSPVLALYSSTGTLITNHWASLAAASPLARGPGGFWGTGIFGVTTNGVLVSLDVNGAATKYGNGIGVQTDLAFGPDGALYVSSFLSDTIWRIAPDGLRVQLLPFAGQLRSMWDSDTNFSYQLQTTTNLLSAAWQDLGSPRPGTGSVMEQDLTISTDPARYYRIKATGR